MSQKPTSKKAYKDVKEKGEDLTARDELLVSLLRDGPATRRELARRTNKEVTYNTVTARCRELLDLDLAREDGTRIDPETDAEAAILHPTSHAIPYLKGNHEPTPKPSLDELRSRVIRHARELVHADGTLWGTTQESGDALTELQDAVEDLEHRDGRL